MKIRHLAAASLAGSALLAGSAHADMIAGWDFSQYFGSNLLSTDGATFTDSLDANYSDFDPTFNAGAESAAFGTMHIDGTNGSTDVNEASSNAAFAPVSGSLASNLDAPVVNPFDSHTILSNEGQQFTNFLSMTAKSSVSAVFSADRTGVATSGNQWSVTFGGRTLSGTSTVTIDVSTDGSSYSSAGCANLDTTDARFDIDLGSSTADRTFVRFNFTPSGQDQPVIDNVAINVPEPASNALAAAALASLCVLRRGRRGVR